MQKMSVGFRNKNYVNETHREREGDKEEKNRETLTISGNEVNAKRLTLFTIVYSLRKFSEPLMIIWKAGVVFFSCLQ